MGLVKSGNRQIWNFTFTARLTPKNGRHNRLWDFSGATCFETI